MTEHKPTVKEKRRTLMWPRQKFFAKEGGMFFTAKEVQEDPVFRKIPGTQNKHHGRQPGSYKRKRDMICKSRKANRGN